MSQPVAHRRVERELAGWQRLAIRAMPQECNGTDRGEGKRDKASSCTHARKLHWVDRNREQRKPEHPQEPPAYQASAPSQHPKTVQKYGHPDKCCNLRPGHPHGRLSQVASAIGRASIGLRHSAA